MSDEKKVDRTELVLKLVEAINCCSEKNDTAKHMVAMGEALAKIGRCLKGVPLEKARAVIQTVAHMNESGLLDIKDKGVSTRAKRGRNGR